MERKSNATERGRTKPVRRKSAVQKSTAQIPVKKTAVGRAKQKRAVPQLTVVTTETWTITWGQEPTPGAQIMGEPVIVVRESVEIFPETDE
jgi:hypothetical protein